MPPDLQNDHRRMKRLAVKKSTSVICRKGTLGLGPNLAIQVLDVSVDGAQLLVNSVLRLGEELELSFAPTGFTEPLIRLAVVVWCSAKEGDGYHVGVRFMDSLEYQDIYHMT
jgi:PilZ domain